MSAPVRCFVCNKPFEDSWQKFTQQKNNTDPQKLLDQLGLTRMCCRAIIESHVNVIDTLLEYEKRRD